MFDIAPLATWRFVPPLESFFVDCLQVTLYNNIPADWPLVSEGISIHWHGFSMNGVPWYDGVGYLAQCPIKSGTNFTYRFQVSLSSTHSSSRLGAATWVPQQTSNLTTALVKSLYFV